MLLSFCGAFVFPSRVTELGKMPVQTLLVPISWPMYRLGNWVRGRIEPRHSEDSRPSATIALENLALKEQVQELTATVAQLQQRLSERASLGGYQTLCDRFEVSGADSDNREGITITGSRISFVRMDQPALSSGSVTDLVGRIDAVRGMTAHVRMVSDAGMAVTGHFVCFSTTTGAQENQDLLAIVVGRGKGEMTINNLWVTDVKHAGIQPGDWLVLRDDSWARGVQGVRVGRVESIEPLPKQPLFAEIRLASVEGLMHLNDVWVMTRQQ
jgi:cell shape-determining protein MreC